MTTTPVTGPYRITVDTTPTGAVLDITPYLHTVILALAEAAAEDGAAFLDALQAITDLDHTARHQRTDAHDRDEAVESLLTQLGIGGTVPVYGQQVLRLADALRRAVAPRPVPSRYEAGAA
ncbi:MULTISPECIES: hypothetical protein [unclassified Streptomyces]|uniref:hypothetical protein n=1 Tax=unclassified Streptomyces TaxID=2593676 RepID=UPI003830C712